MSEADHEAVLNDLLLLLGIEGVTLWHLRCLAAYLREVQRPSGAAAFAELISGQPLPAWQRRIFESHPFALERLKSDLRGFDAVWTSAHLERRRRIEEQRGPAAEVLDLPPLRVDVARGPDRTGVVLFQQEGREVGRIINVAPPLEDPAFQALGLPPDMVNASLDVGAQNSSRTAQEIEELHGAPALTVIECDHHPNTDCARCR